jgi:hypothetical protein
MRKQGRKRDPRKAAPLAAAARHPPSSTKTGWPLHTNNIAAAVAVLSVTFVLWALHAGNGAGPAHDVSPALIHPIDDIILGPPLRIIVGTSVFLAFAYEHITADSTRQCKCRDTIIVRGQLLPPDTDRVSAKIRGIMHLGGVGGDSAGRRLAQALDLRRRQPRPAALGGMCTRSSSAPPGRA